MLKDPRRHSAERGQVLPLWIAGSIAALALAFLTLNYANSVRYQIRAQNAADSAASAVVAIQSDQWNEMTALLYADDVEEFRFRRLLDGMLLAIHRSGGCNPSGYIAPTYNSTTGVYVPVPPPGQPQSWYSTAEGTCNRTYIDMRDNIIRSNNRFQKNENYLNDIALQATFSQFQTNAAAMLSSLQTNCNTDSTTLTNAIGGDCGNGNFSNSIKYSFAPASTTSGYGGMNGNAIAYRTGLGPVELDAADYFIPGLGIVANKHGLDTENAQLFAPVAVDVVACEKITPLIPSFGPFKQTTYYAIGRAAATNAMVNQEWLEPEVTTLAATQTLALQPAEYYTQKTPDSGQSVSYGTNASYDWYSVDFGGNNYTANTTNFTATLSQNELSAYFGWWAPIPILPFGGAVSTATSC
jgi:hypothetical protein